jgi:hypothetical protein
VGKLAGGSALLLIAVFMAFGFLNSDLDASQVTKIATLLLTVGLPGIAGAALVLMELDARSHRGDRKEDLRRQTMDSEILRLASDRGGKLTVVEVMSALALPSEGAKQLLDGLVSREIADVQVSDSGVLVYAFHDLRHLSEKESARGVLDA